ncbi:MULTISPECIES: aldolase/citrate lyase family protein [Aerococcus]|uniref:Citrate lyase subunit beta n=1 Tax=Aerococcus sanguinicola TaxID=119206 RepID=A0A5N1GMP8_9LACT|nr:MULTISPECIES: aldolase/citrate lyase family protein [Aerococcus]KAA9301664.1 citrate lyase subunit beta [Aerococcus sanguinicola]MDK6368924.1 aldolase/citrate lyase family protein [Aerococcus sp. UMB9870]MDK6680262.1 aldolase/citrate lyase family protein [Aerococcus sp. UMB8608]MDK6687263.1 aldolase/citrate lyase family protein [Aerococcus sp. UMB8623]MDK6940360.1 aldolase/citrate lyase family protein [Aerococcus sp. UMB8487]
MRRSVRRTMMFLNTQRASLVKDPYVYGPDCVILDLEDAVSENEKDSARIQLYNTLKYLDYGETEIWVRINPLDTPYYKEDIRAAVAGRCDGIRIAKTESAEDVHIVEELIEKAEDEFGVEKGSTMIMGAIESPTAVFNAKEIAEASERMMGIALSAGDYRRELHAQVTEGGEELFVARSMILMAARAAGIMAFDTVYTDVDNIEGLVKETELIKDMGFDGKSLISPKQIAPVHDVFTPGAKEIRHAENIIMELEENKRKGVGVLVVDGKMVDVAMVEGAQRTLDIAKASGVYKGDLA